MRGSRTYGFICCQGYASSPGWTFEASHLIHCATVHPRSGHFPWVYNWVDQNNSFFGLQSIVYRRLGVYASLRLHPDSVLTQSLHTASRTSSVSTFDFFPGRSGQCPLHQCRYSGLLHFPRVTIRRQLLRSERHCYEQHRMVSFKIQLGRLTDIHCMSLILLICLF